MNTNNQNPSSEFSDKNEAIEFLLQEKADREKKAEWAKTLPGNPRSKTKVVSLKKRLLGASAIAASLLVLFMVVFGNNPMGQDSTKLASSMLLATEFDGSQATRGSSSDEMSEMRKLLSEALDGKDYDRALNLFPELDSELTVEDKFNYAVALVRTESTDLDRILDLTREVLKTDSQYSAEALWISATTNVMKKNNTKAIEELRLILKNDYRYKTKEVEKLLSSIDESY